MELFAKKREVPDAPKAQSNKNVIALSSSLSSVTSQPTFTKTNSTDLDHASTFKELGLCNWICNSTNVMGYKRPTPIQLSCIPAILSGRNVMGCAVTGR